MGDEESSQLVTHFLDDTAQRFCMHGRRYRQNRCGSSIIQLIDEQAQLLEFIFSHFTAQFNF